MKFKNLSTAVAMLSAMWLISGCLHSFKRVNYTQDLSFMPEFVAHNYAPEFTTMSDSVDLYVDYSTCVAEAKKSSYYAATHPSIVDCSPTFYSIKGKNIKKETEDRQMVYQLLSSIKEVNHADIKQAVGRIVNSNRQAVLITDGEYYMQGNVRDNLNNPYLAEEFRAWLRAGRDIYIYSEPYLENGRYGKYRYYMLFTDSELENDINERFARSAPSARNAPLPLAWITILCAVSSQVARVLCFARPRGLRTMKRRAEPI